MKISYKKEMLYKSVQEKIQTNHLSIRKACLTHGMNDTSAYRHWVKKQAVNYSTISSAKFLK